ncbi:MAG: trypsin-like serine protease [Oligoflexales bacterium]
MGKAVALPVIVLAVFSVGCKPSQQTSSSRKGTSSQVMNVPQQGPGTTSPCLKIRNGEATSDYPSVVYVHTLDPNSDGGEFSTCTATFVSHNTAVTATHCLDAKHVQQMSFVQGGKIKDDAVFESSVEALKVFYNGDLETDKNSTSADGEVLDLAIIVFPNNSAPAISKLYPGTPPHRVKSGVLVGYGQQGLGGSNQSGTKRVGVNPQVWSDPAEMAKAGYSERGILLVIGNGEEGGTNKPGEGALTNHGDSGGPLFVDGQIAGVSSFGSDEGYSAYINLDSTASKALIARAEQGGAVFERGATPPASVVSTDTSGCGSSGQKTP